MKPDQLRFVSDAAKEAHDILGDILLGETPLRALREVRLFLARLHFDALKSIEEFNAQHPTGCNSRDPYIGQPDSSAPPKRAGRAPRKKA